VVYVIGIMIVVLVSGCARMDDMRRSTATLSQAARFPPLSSQLKQDGHCYILEAENPDRKISEKVVLVTSPGSQRIVGKAYISQSERRMTLRLEMNAQDMAVLRTLQQKSLSRRMGGKGSWNSMLVFRPVPITASSPGAEHWMTLSLLLEGWPFSELWWGRLAASTSPLELVVEGKSMQWEKVESGHLRRLSTGHAPIVLRQTASK
jgi:hypothetical protein